MPEQFINPNWHVLILHFPLGLLGLGVILEWLSLLWPKSEIRTGARWMIVCGALLGIPTVTLGLYAFRDVVTPGGSVAATWQEVVAQSHWSDVQWRYMLNDLWLEVAGTILAVLLVVIYIAISDEGRSRFYWPGLIGLTIAIGLMVVGGWYSGESVYRHGTAVAVAMPGSGDALQVHADADTSSTAETQAAGQETAGASDEGSGHAEHEHDHGHPAWVYRYLPPIQMHLLGVGFTIAFAMAAIGLSIRRWSQPYGPLPASQIPAPAVRMMDAAPLTPGAGPPASTPVAPAPAVMTPPTVLVPVFPARFWLTAFILALLTALVGLWMTGDWRLHALLGPLQAASRDLSTNRLFWHVIFGLSIVLSTGALILTSRFAPRSRFASGLFIVLLLIAVSLQLWMGVLLLFDGEEGSVLRFNS